jgi:uncharacterized protein VirK/YbjX
LIKPTLLQQALLNGGLLLSRIAINPDLGFDLILGYGGFPGKEGELAIIMRQLGQINDLARLSFSFISKADGYIVYIGGLQGFAAPNSREIVAQASKACSGLSPKRLVMEALFALAKQLGANAILGVSDEQHISRKKVNKHFSYDNYWLEFNGLRNEDGDYSLPLVSIHKDLMDVPTKRRAKYRRQHALLETIHMDTFNVCSAQVPFVRSSPISQDFIGLDTSLKIPVSVVQANTLA